jgi:uncharacterized protein (DUF488 family)
MQRSFYTIGYQSSRVEDFLAALHLARVEMLIDVRDVPLSRKRGFSKTALATFLEKHGIAYAHLKGLGDPKPGREAARAGQYDQFRCIFGKHMATEVAQRDLGRAVNLIQTRPCCLMCFEQEPLPTITRQAWDSSPGCALRIASSLRPRLQRVEARSASSL